MANTITATIIGFTIVIAEHNDFGLICQTIAQEARPASLADADTFLAFHSFNRVGDWDLDDNGGVEATVERVDNRFNGTVAARLDDAIGTTHDDFVLTSVRNAQAGDLISDTELSETYVVAATSTESEESHLVHMVREGEVWHDRYSTNFHPSRLVMVAKKR